MPFRLLTEAQSGCELRETGLGYSLQIFVQAKERRYRCIEVRILEALADRRSPTDPKAWVIKRIIAVEGDIVETRPEYPDRNVIIPQNHFWVEGDEAFHSRDSNSYGPVAHVS